VRDYQNNLVATYKERIAPDILVDVIDYIAKVC
jgi:hypothetical protein